MSAPMEALAGRMVTARLLREKEGGPPHGCGTLQLDQST